MTPATDYLRLMKKMIDVVTHDIRNPLNNILLATAQFKLETLPDKEDTDFYIDIIERNCDRISTLMTEIASIVVQPQGLHWGEYDIVSLLKTLPEIYKEQLNPEDKNIICQVVSGKEKIMAQYDREKLERAMQQLMENAIEASDNGDEVFILAKEEEGMIRIVFQNEGKGINQADLPHIFEPFYTTKERHKGLGLTLVKNVMDAHLGKVTAESDEENGTRIILIFPAAQAEE